MKMKKILKTAALTMLLTMCFGLTSLAAGSVTTSNVNYLAGWQNRISAAPEGGTLNITREDGLNHLDRDLVRLIVERNIDFHMEYTYNGVDYQIVIPGSQAAFDESIPIYGPLYLAAHYSVGAASAPDSVTYTVTRGDTLSRIAAANGTTVAALAALNPQITNVNVIYTGQSINLR